MRGRQDTTGSVNGRIVLVLRARCLDMASGAHSLVDLDPPAIARIFEHPDASADELPIEILSPHPAFSGLTPLYVPRVINHGAAVSPGFLGAMPEIAERYAHAPKLEGAGVSSRVLTRRQAGAAARDEYEKVADQVVLLHVVHGYDEHGESVRMECDPPAIGRVVAIASEARRDACILRKLQHDVIDPVYDIEILEPHHAFSAGDPSWIYGTSRRVGPQVDQPASFTLAPPDIAARYAEVSGLPRFLCSPRPMAIVGEFIRHYVPRANRGFCLVAEEEFDRIMFDATETVLSLSVDEIHALEDRHRSSLQIVPDVPGLKPIDGPKGGSAEVEVVDSVKTFFKVGHLDEIDEDMLQNARLERGMQSAPSP